MCALRAHIKPPIFGNILSGIEKVLTAFSIPEKMFLNIDSLMCALRAHISKILYYIQTFPYKVDFSLCTAVNRGTSFADFY